MKKHYVSFVAIIAMVLCVGCGSSPAAAQQDAPASGRSVNNRIPQFIRDAVKNAPENALVGIGTARMATLSQSRTIATTRARAEISRQMETVIMDMVTDFVAGSEVDHSAVLSFQENITVALSKSRLVGASVVEEDMDDNGNYWTVVMLSNTATVNEINQAVSAAKLAVPAMAAMNAQERMEAAINKHLNTEIGYSDR